MPEIAERDTSYATVAYVTLEGRRQDDLRKADAARINDLMAADRAHNGALVAGVRDTLTQQVDRIDALFSTIARDILAATGRTETTATNLAVQVKELAESTNAMFDKRIQPLEAAINTGSGRTSIVDRVLMAGVVAGLALLVAIASGALGG